MQDRDQFDAEQAANKNDRLDGQKLPEQGGHTAPTKEPNRTDRVLVTECQTNEQATSGAGTDSENSNAAKGDSLSGGGLANGQAADVQSGECELTIDQLIDSHSRFLFGYAYRMAGSISDSEDLTQQTFLIAYQKLSQLRSSSAARSWLCAILRSCWLKSIRRNQPMPASNLEIELTEFLMDGVQEFDFDSQAIQNALQELPPDYRLVLLMYYFEGLSYQEIADKLEVKMGTVMSRLSRAKERVRQRLKSKDSLLDK